MSRGVLPLVGLLWLTAASGELKIEVSEGDASLSEDLRIRSSLHEEPCDAPRWRVRRLFQRAERNIQPGLHAYGYYRASVEKTLTFGDACWEAVFRVDPGPRTRVRRLRIDIQGAARDDPKLAEVLDGLPLSQGDALDHGRYEAIKTTLREFAIEYGYFDFEFSRTELRVHPGQSVADILIQAESGPRYLIGALRVSEHPLDPAFLERLFHIEERSPYKARTVIDLSRRLTDSGYFDRVEVRTRREERSGGEVPLDIQLEAAPRHLWRAGLGFATDTGPRASLKYENRRVTRSGHRFRGELRLSPVESALTADYEIPGRDPLVERFALGTEFLHEDTDSAESQSAALIGRQTLKTGAWTQARFVELLHERSEIAGETTRSTLLMPGINLSRIDADDPLRTSRGYRVELEARAAYEGLLSDASFLQLRANAKGIYRFDGSGRVTTRGSAGMTLGDGIDDLPASLRFFAGGDNSVRGYAYKSLGPVDADDEVTGGRYLLTASLEYEHPVVNDDWWAAAFVDAGNAFDTDSIRLKAGYGVGVRWYSPVGRVRLDIALPSDDSKDSWRLHFGLGADL